MPLVLVSVMWFSISVRRSCRSLIAADEELLEAVL